MMQRILDFLVYWRCMIFHKKEYFEYFDFTVDPDVKRVLYGCKKCDLWRKEF